MSVGRRQFLSALGALAFLVTGCAAKDAGEVTEPPPQAPTAEQPDSEASESSSEEEGGVEVEEDLSQRGPTDEDWPPPSTERQPTIPGDSPTLLFHDIRVGEHEDFYRVVAEFTGEGEPGWVLSYPDQPVEQGRGEPLPVTGTEFLQLDITGTTIPMTEDDYEVYYAGPKTVATGPIEVIEDGTFEGITRIVIGVDEEREVRITTLADPARVVVDFRR